MPLYYNPLSMKLKLNYSERSFSVAAGSALLDMTANAFCGVTTIDFASLGAQDGNHKLTIYQTTKIATAWISATAPGGETLDVEKVTDPIFANPAAWQNVGAGGWAIAGNTATAAALPNTKNLYETVNVAYTLGALYKRQADFVVTAGSIALRFSGVNGPTIATTGTHSTYITDTIASTTVNHAIITDFTGTIQNTSNKRVLTPAVTAALLLSTKGGARGWESNTGIDPNAAMVIKVSR